MLRVHESPRPADHIVRKTGKTDLALLPDMPTISDRCSDLLAGTRESLCDELIEAFPFTFCLNVEVPVDVGRQPDHEPP